jgi:hypothetical protein
VSQKPLDSLDADPKVSPRFGHREEGVLKVGRGDVRPGRPRVLFLSGLMREPVIVRSQG